MGSTTSTKGIRLAASVGLASATLVACSSGNASDSTNADGSCDWAPEEGVTVVVPFDPGGGSDLFSRAVAKGLEEVRPDLDISVENRPGGSGTIGYTYFFEKTGDPHFLLGAENAVVSLPLDHDEMPFDATSWTPLGNVVEDTIFLVTNEDSGWRSFDDFLEAARQADEEGDPLSIAQPTDDSIEAMPLKSVLAEEDVTVEYVTFDGSAGAIPGLLAGDIDGVLANPAEVEGQVQSGDFVPIVANTANSIEGAYGEVPAYEDLGYEPTGAFPQFRGVIAPPDVDECAQEYWIEALRDWVKTDSYRAYVESNVVAPKQIWGDKWFAYLEDVEAGYREVVED